jgi:hypothetical protein
MGDAHSPRQHITEAASLDPTATFDGISNNTVKLERAADPSVVAGARVARDSPPSRYSAPVAVDAGAVRDMRLSLASGAPVAITPAG